MTEFRQRQIGRTALRVTELGLGCATLGGSQIAVARATAEEIVGAAWAAGITTDIWLPDPAAAQSPHNAALCCRRSDGANRGQSVKGRR